jgi:carbamoyltransferase|tara:strand:- start:1626 stop:3431 length:1806 start_codon:yes stop_codon:yes gene_type:complete
MALIKDGRLVGTSSTERFTRVKKDSVIDRDYLDKFLVNWDISLKDVDLITFSTWTAQLAPFMQIYSPLDQKYPLSQYGTWAAESKVLNHLPDHAKVTKTIHGYTLPSMIHRTCTPYTSADINMNNGFFMNIRIDGIDKTFNGYFCDHHLSHAASVFYTSDFDKSAIFTADASMHHEEASAGMYIGEGTKIQQFKNPGYMFGNFYDIATEHLGIGPGVIKAGSLMGLAAYGRISKKAYDNWKEWTAPQSISKFDKEYHRYIDWLFTQLSGRFPMVTRGDRDAIKNNEKDAHHYTRNSQQPFSNEESTSQEVMDIAADVQFLTERSLVDAAQKLFEESKTINGGNLCLSGGIFLNCNANYKIQTETDFERMHMFPACGDDGTAAGSALYYLHYHLNYPRQKYTTAQLSYTGCDWYDGHLEGGTKLDLKVVAKHLNDDKIICWYDGPSENGPRALGHRSFLASPKNNSMKDKMNARVKFREWYRPFAPIVLAEKAKDWFVMDFETPFMLHTVPCKKPFDIPAAVHIDNSARVQTLTKDHNEKLYTLIEEFEALSGVPVLINTSLNVKGEPIVESPNDAMDLFKRSDVDVLVINNMMWTKDAKKQ